jgi:hypothetical protein
LDTETAKQIVNDQNKKREKSYSNDAVKLRGVAIERDTDTNA